MSRSTDLSTCSYRAILAYLILSSRPVFYTLLSSLLLSDLTESSLIYVSMPLCLYASMLLCLCISLSIHLSNCLDLFAHRPIVGLSIYLSAYLCIYVCVFMSLFFYWFVCLFTCQHVHIIACTWQTTACHDPWSCPSFLKC